MGWGFGNPFEGAMDAIGDAAQSAAEAAAQAAQAAADAASREAQNAKSSIEEAVEDAGNMARDAGAAIEQAADEGRKKVAEGIANAPDAMASARDSAIEGAATAAKAAEYVATHPVESAKAAGEAVVDGAKAVPGAIANIPGMMDEAARARLEAEIADYKPHREEALRSLELSSAMPILEALGDSPLPVTFPLSNQIKEFFPVPREQTILWVDAEFDLRPSGIVVTDRGVFIKTDANAFVFGWNQRTEDNRSRLSFFAWPYFDPAWFSDDVDNTPLSGVYPGCTQRFIEGCKKVASEQKAREEKELSVSLDDDEPADGVSVVTPGAAGTLGSTGVTSSDNAADLEKYAAIRNPTGHGVLAEEANTIVDKLTFHEAKTVGRDNAKNGPDRIVDGVLIQTKYHDSARGSLESCFDPTTGMYRYVDKAGKPMQLEVPKDQYESVLFNFKKKIKQGKVKGVTNPDDAEKYVRKGHLTYSQAKNLAKPGTVESLGYDAATGIVTCSCAFGISFIATTFMTFQRTDDIHRAIQAGVAAGFEVFGISFLEHIVIAQLARTSLPGTLAAPASAIVQGLGYKTSAVIVNGLRALSGNPPIHGAAASKQLAKIIRSGAFSAAVTVVVLGVPETHKLMNGRVSGAQYAKNMTSIAASVVGGMGGAAVAGVATAKVAAVAGTTVAPGVGTAAGIVGGFAGGFAASMVATAATDIIYEGDSILFSRFLDAMVSAMAVEYMLSGSEMDCLVEKLSNRDEKAYAKLVEDTFGSQEQESAVRAFLAPTFDEVVSARSRFSDPTTAQINEALMGFEASATTAT